MNLHPSSLKWPAAPALRAIGDASRLRHYFAFHGLWAPGVRLMRQLRMGWKAVVVAVAFLLPMLVVGVVVVRQQLAEEAQARAARDAVLQAAAITELMRVVLAERLALQADQVPSPESATAARDALRAVLPPPGAAADAAGPAAARALQAWRLAEARLDSIARQDGAARLQAVSTAHDALAELHQALVRDSGVLREVDPALWGLATLVLRDTRELGREVGNLRALLADAARAGRLQAADPADLQRLREQALRHLSMANQAFSPVATTLLDPSLELLPDAGQRLARLREPLAKADALLAEDRPLPDLAGVARLAQQAHEAVRDLRTPGLQRLAERFDQRLQALHAAQRQLLVAVVLLLALAVYLKLSFLRVLDGGVDYLRREVTRLSEGDLSARPQALGQDEIAVALGALSNSLARMSDLLSAVRQGVAAMTHATHEIASGNGNLSSRTDATASSIAQILQGVTLFSTELDRSGEQVSDAMQAVQALRLVALRSRRQMEALGQRMQSLQGHSRQIGEIVGMIDGIAFRTNILALNASVEAAKAGDAGRGFAVVAQEVRSLAQRSAASAQRIADIVRCSTDDIEQGHALTAETRQSLDENHRHVEQIHQTMDRIVELNRTGRQTTAGIVDELSSLDAHTRANNALVGQLAEAADSLRRQGERLNRKVETFRLT